MFQIMYIIFSFFQKRENNIYPMAVLSTFVIIFLQYPSKHINNKSTKQ